MITDDFRQLRERAGLSRDKLAELMGYKGGSSIQRYEDETLFKEEFLPPRIIHRLMKIVGKGIPPITEQEVARLGGPFVAKFADGSLTLPEGAQKSEVRGGRIALYGSARGGPDGQFEMQGQELDRILCPPIVSGVADAYAVRVIGDSMSPKYEDGQTVYINPNVIPRLGNYVVAQIRSDPSRGPDAFVKRFVKWTWDELVLEQFNPEKTLRFPASEVVAVHRIVGSDEP